MNAKKQIIKKSIVIIITYILTSLNSVIYAQKNANMVRILTDKDSSIIKPNEIFLDIKTLSISSLGTTFIYKHEGCILQVYNDLKGGKSDFCQEHYDNSANSTIRLKAGHKLIASSCNDSTHAVLNVGEKIKYGKPTICVGYLIFEESELFNFCYNQSIKKISQDSCLNIFTKQSLPIHVNLLRKSLLENSCFTQCQFDALVSICFNRGIGNFKKSTLYKKYLSNQLEIDEDDSSDIREAIINDGSKKIVKNRRKEEANLFFDCIY